MKKRVLVAMLMAVCAAAVAAEPPQGKGHAHHHAHDAVIDVPEGPDAPTLALEAQKDPVGGWNVHVRTTHFSFAPERVNGPHRPGEGHGHLYVDGKKVARSTCLPGGRGPRWNHGP
jgi:fatty acid desaturase